MESGAVDPVGQEGARVAGSGRGGQQVCLDLCREADLRANGTRAP